LAVTTAQHKPVPPLSPASDAELRTVITRGGVSQAGSVAGTPVATPVKRGAQRTDLDDVYLNNDETANTNGNAGGVAQDLSKKFS
jgi:hypothetical protein